MKMLTHLHMVVYTSALLRKLSVYFLLHRWDFLEKSRECFSPDVVLAAPDAGPERPVWCQFVAQVCRVHRTHRSESGAQRPVRGRFGDPLCLCVR